MIESPDVKCNNSLMDLSNAPHASRSQTDVTSRESLELRVLGVRCVSGRLDTLDFALVHYRQDSPEDPLHLEILETEKRGVSSSVTDPILNTLREVQNRPTVATDMATRIGELFTDGIRSFCTRHGISIDSIDCIGTYIPDLGRGKTSPAPGRRNHTHDWNTYVRNKTGLTTISDFTISQIAHSRLQTSPVAYTDATLLRHPHRFRACLNINELVNICFVPPNAEGSDQTTMSRACGPGSIFIDYSMRYSTNNDKITDREGEFAAKGSINQAIVDRFLDSHDYLHLTPPPDMAREMFGDHDAQRLIDECLFVGLSDVDVVATITRITAQNILRQYRKLLADFFPDGQQMDELFVCGSGAHNASIVDYLENELPESLLTRPMDDVGIPGDAHETLCYAHLALEALLGQTTRGSEGTARIQEAPRREGLGARIAPGENWDTLSERVRKFSGGNPLRISKEVKIQGWESNGTS